MSEREDESQVLGLLRVYGIESNRLAHRYATAAAVHPTDLEALELLGRDGVDDTGMTVGALGTALGLSSAATTGLVDRLESAGHVERIRDPRDRRRVNVRVAGEALAMATVHFGPWLERLEGVTSRLNDADLEVVTRFLVDVVAATRAASSHP